MNSYIQITLFLIFFFSLLILFSLSLWHLSFKKVHDNRNSIILYKKAILADKTNFIKLKRLREVLGLSESEAKKVEEGKFDENLFTEPRPVPSYILKAKKNVRKVALISLIIFIVDYISFNYFPTYLPEAFTRIMLNLPREYVFDKYLKYLGENSLLTPTSFQTGIVEPVNFPTYNSIVGKTSGYSITNILGFTFLYTEYNSSFISELELGRLNELAAIAKTTLEVTPQKGPFVLLPNNLSNFLGYSVNRTRKVNWLPLGFQTGAMICMWPPNLQRYGGIEGKYYQSRIEFYKVLLHEYTHYLLGNYEDNAYSLPGWIHEGSALYVESKFHLNSQREKKEWLVAFEGAMKMNRLLDWGMMNRSHPYDLTEEKASIYYAQSFAMVYYLVKNHGIRQWNQFLRAMYFRKDNSAYEEVFSETYGFTWRENVNRKAKFYKEYFDK